MSILVYSGKEGMHGKEILSAVREGFPGRKIVSVKGIEDLRDRFGRPLWDLDCVVMLLSSRDELDELFSVREFICNMPVIMIAPDSRPETLSIAHRFYPRFVTSPEHGFNEVVLVLEKMLDRAEGRKTAQQGAV